MAETAPETYGPPPMDKTEIESKLNALKASATQQYSLKNYSAAADLYSEAAGLQDDLNGEMSVDNADLLYQYGRCLYHVAISKSDVLGSKVASSEEPKRKKRKVKAESSTTIGATDAPRSREGKLAEEIVEAAVEEKEGAKERIEEQPVAKPYFSITGDENWTDDEVEDAESEAGGDDEDDDDFAIAYEILDVARVLLGRRIQSLEDSGGKARETVDQMQLKERLADTHDLQAEISLENERFTDAIQDTKQALELKLQLYPQESSLIAEAHFKLSLALEFASVTQAEGEDAAEDGASKEAQVDENMRKEAAMEMEKAIASCKLRIANEQASLAGLDANKTEEKQKSISDVTEMITDMEQRLADLRNPGVSLSGGSNPLEGILGSMLGESKEHQKKLLEEATKSANDLSGLVKHKKNPKAETKVANGAEAEVKAKKRKLKVDEEGAAEANGKKAKFDDGSAV